MLSPRSVSLSYYPEVGRVERSSDHYLITLGHSLDVSYMRLMLMCSSDRDYRVKEVFRGN